MNKIRFALLGCGKIAKKHAEILSNQMPDAMLTAVYDTNNSQG